MSGKNKTTERGQDKNSYNLYCVNIYGSGLNSIKNEFKHQVESGLRPTVFILDLDDLQDTLNQQQRNSKLQTEFHKNYGSHLMNAILQQIQRFCKEYVLKKKKISDELKFDLNQYWLKDLENISKLKLGDSIRISEDKKNKVEKIKNYTLPSLIEEVLIQCTIPISFKEHNRVGQPELLSRRKYINDDPSMGKLYIIIVGHMTDNFFLDLLRRDQPLCGIVRYVPTESNYDVLMGNNKLRTFIMESVEVINTSIYNLRQEVRMKAVGLFHYKLPIISTCLATKYAPEIFNQLTWSIYDIEMLEHQYETYYYRPYQETDVGIPPTVDITELYHVAVSLSVQGHFQKVSLPGSAADFATILFYLGSLLNTFGSPDGLLKENEVSVLSETEYNKPLTNHVNYDTVNNYKNSFSSITKISKYERIFLEGNNKLLYNMFQYVDHIVFSNIYLSCLDYNIVRQYVLPTYLRDSVTNNKTLKCDDVNPLPLPQYAKYYANADCSSQRISELLTKFEVVQINEIFPGCKLYTFKRTHSKIIENEGMGVIPTRLCFRDFTLFQMDEFIDNLKWQETQKMPKEQIQSEKKKKTNIDIDNSIYMRPNSLKSINMQTDKKSDLPTGKGNIPLIKSNLDKKASLSMSLRQSENRVGLAPDHKLLKGYNLEDVRQEIKYKTSKYYYENGFVELYVEKWCFQDMNKELIFSINNSTLFLNGLHSQPESLCNNIRLITSSNISIRLLNDSKECSKIVMNYPNGLNVYYHDMLCEQIWCCDQTPNEELRRIFTPYGGIIVFFKANEMILIMRYNGEVYKLYQYELVEGEEEQDLISEFSEILEQSSGIKDMKEQGDTPKADKNDNNNFKNIEKQIDHSDKLNKTEKDKNKIKYKTEKPISLDTNSNKFISDNSAKIQISSLSTSLSDHLKASIKYELDYLNFISSTYMLNYLHVIVTTSQGKRLHLTNNGKIFEEKRCIVEEWHDYFANEAYCQRSDDVKMIWTKDAFKCYHKDGSVLTTKTEQVYENADGDEFEPLISKSSSHYDLVKKENEDITNLFEHELGKNEHTHIADDLQPISSQYSRYLMTEFAEEHEREDTRYIFYTCSSCLLQHHHYADVHLVWLNRYSSNPPVLMEIIGIDDIRIYIDSEKCFEDGEYVSELDSLRSDLELDQKYNTSVEKQEIKIKINVSVGKNLQVTTDNDGCEICAVMQRTDEHEQIDECDSLILRFEYKDCINDVFKYIVNEIATLKRTAEKSEELLFLEKMDNECNRRGFEFLNNKPLLSKYNYEISNFITDVKVLKPIHELMTNFFEWYESDMKKFPRFQKFRNEILPNPEMKFPRVLSTNVYVKIPFLLQNTADISKFLEPFDDINFKTLRSKFKDLLDLHLNPKMQLDIKLLYSTKNWIKRHWEHQRRKLTEQQRMGLYHAIIKYKKYPNYWIFLQDYSGQVAYIDFLDFMQHTC